MTNEQQKAKELAELLNAFADGKQLQIEVDGYKWKDYFPNLDTLKVKIYKDEILRIKPETKRVALNQQDIIERIELGDSMWIKNIHNGVIYQIIAIHILEIQVQHGRIAFDTLAANYTFLDGTPCYKEANNE